MKTTPSGKTLYVAITGSGMINKTTFNKPTAVRIKAYSKPKATIKAAMIFANVIKGWTPEVGGIVEAASRREIRNYIREHQDIEWINGGAPIDA